MSGPWRPRAIRGVPDNLILFDGVCVLCSQWVRFVIDRDVSAQFRFVPIQSSYGLSLARRLRIDAKNPETNAVVIGEQAYFKSDAVIHVLDRLPRLSWLAIFGFVPRPLRDWAYDRLARNRYRLFGKTETCIVPTPEAVRRFFFDDPRSR